MNNTIWLIFNEKVVRKWDLWVLWIVHGTHWCAKKSNIAATIHEQCMNNSCNDAICPWNECQKKGVQRTNVTQIHMYPNGYIE